jgi:hypothetical protein
VGTNPAFLEMQQQYNILDRYGLRTANRYSMFLWYSTSTFEIPKMELMSWYLRHWPFSSTTDQ